MTIKGWKLPDVFVALIDRPKPLIFWVPKGGDESWVYQGGKDGVYWRQISTADSDAGLTMVQLCGSLAEVEKETNRLPATFHVGEYTPEEIAEVNASNAHLLGFLPFSTDFSQLVRFGMSGCGEPFCFDYREHPDGPSIIHWNDAYWRRFSPNFDALLSMYDDLESKKDDDDW